MSKKGKRQQNLRENFLNKYKDFPIEKINNVLILGGWLRNLRLGITTPTYNKETEEITFNISSSIKKKKIRIEVIKKIDSNTVNISIFLNNSLHTSENNIIEKLAVRRINDILQTILSTKIYSDEEVFTILEKVVYANSLAKQNLENKSFLYAVKHNFVKYIVLNHSSLIKYKKPTTTTGVDKLLEIKIGETIFHLPYDKKNRYGFTWTDDTKPEIYIKKEAIDVPENLDIDQLNRDLFYIYLKLSGGKVTCIKSDAVRYWYTREILKKLYKNNNINLIRETEDGLSNYCAQPGTKYKLVDIKTEKILEEASFRSFFSMAICSNEKL